MFSKPLSPFQSQKQTNAFYEVSRRFFLALSWTTSSWRGIKNLFRLQPTRKQKKKKPCKHSAVVQTKKTEKRQRKKCQGHIYRRRNKYFQRRHVLWKHEKEYYYLRTPLAIVVLRKVQNRADLELEVQTCTADLASYLLTQWQFWQLTLKWLSRARTRDKTKQYYCCFLFFLFYSIMRFKKNSLPDSWIPR